MKITITHEDRIVTVEDGNVVDIQDTLMLIKDAIMALGFHNSTVRDGIIELAKAYEEEKNEKEEE
jgi:hypothetical protein